MSIKSSSYFALTIAVVIALSSIDAAFAQSFAFERQEWIADGSPRIPSVVDLFASASANGLSDSSEHGEGTHLNMGKALIRMN